MPVSSVLTREEFLNWIGGNMVVRATSGISASRMLSSAEIMLVWAHSADIPNAANAPLIVVNRKSIRDFFAFTSTYVSTYSPFSAYFRVVSSDVIFDVLNTEEPNKIPFSEEFVALPIAEAFLQSRGEISLDKLSVQAGLATISFAVLSALARGYERSVVERILPTWSGARGLLTSEKLPLDADGMAAFWQPVLDAFYQKETVSNYSSYARAIEFIQLQLFEGLSAERFGWNRLTLGMPLELSEANLDITSTREDRVRSLGRALEALELSKTTEPLLKEIVAGYLLARIGNGSLDYLGACDQFLETIPRAVLWFGFFLGCWRNKDVLTSSECLGRRLSRHLFSWTGPFSAPIGDLNYNELEVRISNGRSGHRFRTEHQTVALVELLPGVTARYKIARAGNETLNDQRLVSQIDSGGLRQIRSALTSAMRMLDKIDVQRTLFDDTVPPAKPKNRR